MIRIDCFAGSERDGTFTVYRRRDNESKVARLGRMMSGAGDDGRVPAVPAADAPTWFALMSGMKLPRGSIGYALPRSAGRIERQAAGNLIAELAPRSQQGQLRRFRVRISDKTP